MDLSHTGIVALSKRWIYSHLRIRVNDWRNTSSVSKCYPKNGTWRVKCFGMRHYKLSMRIMNDRTECVWICSRIIFSCRPIINSSPSFILLGKCFFFQWQCSKRAPWGYSKFLITACCIFVKRTDVLTPWAEGWEVPVMNKLSGCPKKYMKPTGTLLNRDAFDTLNYLVVGRRKLPFSRVEFLAFHLYKGVSSRDFANGSLWPFSIFKLVNYFHATANRRRVYWL